MPAWVALRDQIDQLSASYFLWRGISSALTAPAAVMIWWVATISTKNSIDESLIFSPCKVTAAGWSTNLCGRENNPDKFPDRSGWTAIIHYLLFLLPWTISFLLRR
jgi:hypothetical protein